MTGPGGAHWRAGAWRLSIQVLGKREQAFTKRFSMTGPAAQYSTSSAMRAAMSSGCGSTAFMRSTLYGVGTSGMAIR